MGDCQILYTKLSQFLHHEYKLFFLRNVNKYIKLGCTQMKYFLEQCRGSGGAVNSLALAENALRSKI